MSNPARAPKELTEKQLRLQVAPDAYLPEGFAARAKAFKEQQSAARVLAGLDMDLAPAIVVPRELTVDARVRGSSKPCLAVAKVGVPVPRVRTVEAKTLVNRVFAKLPEEGRFSREAVGMVMKDKVYVDAGVEGALGRLELAYPARGCRPPMPTTREEAEVALGRCGLRVRHMPVAALRPYPLVALDGEQSVTVNKRSDNGFPVLGTWGTPGAASLCASLAVSCREEIRREGDGERWLRKAELERPWLVAVKGKAKADYYTPDKVALARMRFYNAFPRQTTMIMQQATQPFELNSRSILQEGHSGIGVTLVHGGAGDLVEALEKQLARSGEAYVHVGDDSWVVLRRGPRLIQFALDCSNFDLTQHSATTLEVDVALRKELEAIDPLAAGLWFGYARERLVVTTGSLVRRWRHAGPSGMPLQSKRNDVLMDVMINRTLRRLEGTEADEETVAEVVAAVGRGLGFAVKLEQYGSRSAESLQDALQQQSFLFIGYYFHVRGGEVRVHADVPRTLAQVPYPSVKWYQKDGERTVMETMRLGSIALGLGLPSPELDEAFGEFRLAALELLDRVIAEFGDRTDESLRWAVAESPFGPDTAPSLKGLQRALQKDAGLLWLYKEPELPHTSIFLEPARSWADLTLEEEAEMAQALGGVIARPGENLSVRRVALPSGRVPTHPVTVGNDGRPPPTVVWAPDRAPRPRWDDSVRLAGRRTRRRDGILAREFAQALEDEWLGESDDEESFWE